MIEGILYGAVGTLAGLGLGLAGWRLGLRWAGGPAALDERHRLVRGEAAHGAWLLTLAALMVMWALIEFRVVASAGVAVWAVFLFSIAAFVGLGAVLDRRR